MNTSPTIGELFAAQQAEIEHPWLHQVFVAPPQLADFTHPRSTAIIGGSGSGKTALRLMLLEQVVRDRLIVTWLPKLLQVTEQPTIALLVDDLLKTIAREMIKALGREPERFDNATTWVQEELATVISTLFPKNAATKRMIGRLGIGLDARGQQLVAQLLLPDQPLDSYGDARPQQVLEDLIACLPEVGYRRVWVVVDGLERLEISIDEGLHTVETLCAMLALFELPELTFKLLVPYSFVDIVQQSRSVQRRRLSIAYLRWSETALVQLLERRLAFLLDQPDATLAIIVDSNLLLQQLRTQEATPRAWIEGIRPLVEQFYANGADAPLTSEMFVQFVRPTIPQIQISGDRVLINGREKSSIKPQARQILNYLFARRGRVCTREEIYYCVLRGMSEVPHKDDPRYEDPSQWRSALDTALNRLRESIEPDSKHPIFVQTKRGQGVMLVVSQ